MQIASGIHRIGNRSIINAYLIEEANEVTLVDAGIAGLYRDLPKELASMGRTIEDVRALILTHGHSDHIGFAERSAPSDTSRYRSTKPTRRSLAARWRTPPKVSVRPRPGRWSGSSGSRCCVADFGPVTSVRSRRSVTARPSTCPGALSSPSRQATPGSAVLHFRSLGALLIGDAFATYAVTTGARGPRVAPFTADAAQAVESLTRIEDVSSDLVLPGHGDPWTGGVEEAVRLVRESAAPGVQG